MASPAVRPEVYADHACPRCGRPVLWVGYWQQDGPDGALFVRKAFRYRSGKNTHPNDRIVNVIEDPTRFESSIDQVWEHALTLKCSRCCWMGTEGETTAHDFTTTELKEMHLLHVYYQDCVDS